MNDIEKKYMDRYAESFFPPETPQQNLPEVFPMKAGAMQAEMKPIPQTEIQRLAEKAGMTLEEYGKALESVGSVKLGQFEITLRDLFPFVGDSVEETDPVTGEVTERQTGFPAALQQYGQGVSMTTGTGFARQLRPDFKESVFDLLELAGILKGGVRVGEEMVESATEALTPIVREVNRDLGIMTREVDEAMLRRSREAAKGAE